MTPESGASPELTQTGLFPRTRWVWPGRAPYGGSAGRDALTGPFRDIGRASRPGPARHRGAVVLTGTSRPPWIRRNTRRYAAAPGNGPIPLGESIVTRAPRHCYVVAA
ncbi:hypothetical protein Srufu_032680 [Streptomyces libani subsp. rufus]|nr:hypothetical protein Srufu_032680 [Streptomyces libani subsp. rufus]